MTDDPKSPMSPTAEAAQRSQTAPDEPSAGGYRVQLPTFEGPLDLLLHLIQEHELDILNIPIGFVAEKYVEYITLMDELNIDIASEYLVMAATLTHIKSKMLLPVVPQDQDDPDSQEDVDPRAELVRRLLEYQKYKKAAEELGGRSVFGRDVFGRGAPPPGAEGTAPLAPIGLFKLIDAFQSVLDRAKIQVDHQIDLERFSITDRINELADVLRSRPRVLFEDLFAEQTSRAELIITFLALLEMTRLRMTRLYQTGPLAPIFVELAVTDDADATGDLSLQEPATSSAADGDGEVLPPEDPPDDANALTEGASTVGAEPDQGYDSTAEPPPDRPEAPQESSSNGDEEAN